MSTTISGVGTVEELHASASKVVGLTDFGADEYLEPLQVLLGSYANDEQLTPYGNKVKRAELRGALVARLLSEAAFAQHPTDSAIERPIFVTGLPRTGTTALHRLLCADPTHQGLELWLAEMPQPRPPRETWAGNPIYQHIAANFEKFHAEKPDFAGVHYMSADTVEECWQLLRQSLMSISYESLAYLPSYSSWLAGRDWTPAYARHRRNLALIGSNEPDRRWILKNPSHLFALDALLAVYPDAVIVQTHRAPHTLIASSCSLSAQASAGQSEKFTGQVIGRSQLDLWARGAAGFAEARTRHDPSQFLDVRYDDFVADPVATAVGVYEHFGLPLSDEARAAVVAADAESRSAERRPSHRYALEEFGLTEATVDERFSGYEAAYLS
ncbi:MAG TPA: sulfotransferase [Jatrophihabitantaceae bacterium]|nr:sulfotransferase [Jatrophihabitantaceae bacterium]